MINIIEATQGLIYFIEMGVRRNLFQKILTLNFVKVYVFKALFFSHFLKNPGSQFTRNQLLRNKINSI